MASRRDLKKHVNYISEVTVGMCIIEGMNAEGERREAIANLVEKTLNLLQKTEIGFQYTD